MNKLKNIGLAAILGLSTAACASTSALKANIPSEPEKEVYIAGIKISRGVELPKEKKEYDSRVKFVFDASPDGAGPDFLSDMFTVTCPTGKVAEIDTGRVNRLYMTEEALSVLKKQDNMIRIFNNMAEEYIRTSKLKNVPELDLFDYTKDRTVTVYLYKGKMSEDKTVFNPNELAIEMRLYTEGKEKEVLYSFKGSKTTNFITEAKKGKADKADDAEDIKIGQMIFASIANLYIATQDSPNTVIHCMRAGK